MMDPSLHLEPDLRAIFANEADRRLTSLATGLWQIELGKIDDRLMNSLLLDASALKGAAAVLWFDDVARVAHALGEVLASVGESSESRTPPVIHAVRDALDGLRAMVGDLLAGDDVARRAAICEATLLSLAGAPASAWPPSVAAPTPAPEEPEAAPAPGPATEPAAEPAAAPRLDDRSPTSELPVVLVEFRTPAGLFAIPLEAARVVKAASSMVPRRNGTAAVNGNAGVIGVVEHEGDAIPVLSALGGGSRHVLVMASGSRVFGLVVDRVVGLSVSAAGEQSASLIDPCDLARTLDS